MNKQKNEFVGNGGTLTDAARTLLAATSEVAGEKVATARQCLSSALERGKEIYAEVQDKTLAGAKTGDKFVRSNPYVAVSIAVGVGTIIGYLLGRRNEGE